MTTLARNLGQIAIAAAVALAITAVGQGLWGVMVMVNVKLTPALPWAPPLMALVLAALVAFLTGRGWPRRGAAARRALAPLGPVTASAWIWSLIAGAAGVIALAALWTVMARIVRVPPNALPDTHGLPVLTLGAILVVSIIAAPLTEEIAFRGYAMGLLRRRFGPIWALMITSVLFAAAHLTQGFYAPKLLVYLMVGLGLGFIALRTGSLLPAMVVHSFGDLTFFTQVWNHDAGRRLIGRGGPDGAFWLDLVILALAAPLCVVASCYLVKATPLATARVGAAPRGSGRIHQSSLA